MAVEFGILPDELVERIDRTARRTGRTWRHVFAEVIAHYELTEQERRAEDARRRARQFLMGHAVATWGSANGSGGNGRG